MTIEKAWCDIADAEARYGVRRERILAWVDEGVVRAEEEGGKVVRINLDDLELKVQEMTGL